MAAGARTSKPATTAQMVPTRRPVTIDGRPIRESNPGECVTRIREPLIGTSDQPVSLYSGPGMSAKIHRHVASRTCDKPSWLRYLAPGMQPITSTRTLAETCARLARHPFVTVDTEFLR